MSAFRRRAAESAPELVIEVGPAGITNYACNAFDILPVGEQVGRAEQTRFPKILAERTPGVLKEQPAEMTARHLSSLRQETQREIPMTAVFPDKANYFGNYGVWVTTFWRIHILRLWPTR